jgi:hypothetical protein
MNPTRHVLRKLTAPDLRVISLGAGVQSTALYLLAVEGRIGPRPDVAIFADTQCEPPWVYENVERLKALEEIPIEVVSAGDLGEAVEQGVNSTGERFAAVPFWVAGSDGSERPGRRQCTREYKIDVVKRAIREHLGLKKGARAAGRFHVEEWVGISTDEASRAKPSRYNWITTRWPLLWDLGWSRAACKAYLERMGWGIPGKSACTFCPYRKPVEYARWRDDHPELFEEACRVDDLIRSKGTMRGEQFVWRALKPLRELPPLAELKAAPDGQIDLFENECEGMCGV